uniref:D-isomer specific 2-hydroxyacid dehydrogenase catalytic domain-containing protein n=1 Tax=Daucus carota subsp. sativus TaxID=79200 RepID=A0A161ZYK9_DAUCS
MNRVLSAAAALGKNRKMSGEAAETSINRLRLLFCGPHFAAADIYTREYLQAHCPLIQVDSVPLDDVARVIGNYDMCVVKSMRLNSTIISRVDIHAATTHGIKVAKIPSAKTGNAASCAEMAIYLMLGLLRKQVGPT